LPCGVGGEAGGHARGRDRLIVIDDIELDTGGLSHQFEQRFAAGGHDAAMLGLGETMGQHGRRHRQRKGKRGASRKAIGHETTPVLGLIIRACERG
jgi:hypothetical protein